MVYSSNTTTSRAYRTSTAKREPASVTMHARLWGTAVGAGRVVTAGVPMTGSPDELPDYHDELLGREGLAEILVGSLSLAPHPIALLVLRAHQHHGHGLGALVTLEAPQDLVAVSVRHDDIEEQQIRSLEDDTLFQCLTVGKTDNFVTGRLENALDESELRLGVVYDHHFGH